VEECRMGDEQQSQTTAIAGQATRTSACPHPEAVGKRWGDPISEERQAELRAMAEQQREWAKQPETARGDSFFKDVSLTGADVFWLAVLELAGSMGDMAQAEVELLDVTMYGPLFYLENPTEHDRAYMNLLTLHLEGALLFDAHLEGSWLTAAHLEGTRLDRAHLEKASLDEIQLGEPASVRHIWRRLGSKRLNWQGLGLTKCIWRKPTYTEQI
jgi:hypothetical protein